MFNTSLTKLTQYAKLNGRDEEHDKNIRKIIAICNAGIDWGF